MTKARDLANFVSTGSPLSDGTLAVADISDLTASAAELNVLDGVTATTAKLNYLDITTIGVSQASKVITTDASNNTNIGGTVTAGFFSGNGSNLTNLPTAAPTTAQVLNATAGATHGSVGTYAYLGRTTSGSISPGSTFAGSSLVFAAFDHGHSFTNQSAGTTNNSRGAGGTPTGTWMAMGGTSFTTGFIGTLFLRIS